MSEAILKLKNDKELCNEMGIKGYEFGHDLYSKSTNMKKYTQLFLKLSK